VRACVREVVCGCGCIGACGPVCLRASVCAYAPPRSPCACERACASAVASDPAHLRSPNAAAPFAAGSGNKFRVGWNGGRFPAAPGCAPQCASCYAFCVLRAPALRHTHTYTHALTHERKREDALTCTDACACAHTCTHTQTHKHTHTHRHTHTRAHTHTHALEHD
jgi:hypothetical protein